MTTDTDYSQAVRLQHLSPTWVKKLDEQYGEAKAQNGGYVDFEIKFEQGRPRPRWYRMALQFQPWLDKLIGQKKH